MVNVNKYTIHGCYGFVEHPGSGDFLFFLSVLRHFWGLLGESFIDCWRHIFVGQMIRSKLSEKGSLAEGLVINNLQDILDNAICNREEFTC